LARVLLGIRSRLDHKQGLGRHVDGTDTRKR